MVEKAGARSKRQTANRALSRRGSPDKDIANMISKRRKEKKTYQKQAKNRSSPITIKNIHKRRHQAQTRTAFYKLLNKKHSLKNVYHLPKPDRTKKGTSR